VGRFADHTVKYEAIADKNR